MAMKKDFGAFELHEKIGSGGMASVYLGVQKSLDRKVVLKVLYPHLAEDEKLVARFEREARAAAMMRHENIVQVIDTGRFEDVAYIAMEYVEGLDLKKWLETHGPPPLEMALLILRDTCRGLEHAHSHRIVHRDIKPANVMLTNDGQIKIMDFGLARRGEESTAVTVVGSVLGTPAYMSPEQATGDMVDERSDIFSTGVVGYELLGGQRPFLGDSYSTVLRSILTIEPPPLESLNPLVPDEVVGLIHKMLQKDMSKRYQSIWIVRGDLETVIEQMGLHRGKDLLREYVQEPDRVRDVLQKKRLARHFDQGLYFENMGLGKIDDAAKEFQRVLYLDPGNQVARDHLAKLESERGRVTDEVEAQAADAPAPAAPAAPASSASAPPAMPPQDDRTIVMEPGAPMPQAAKPAPPKPAPAKQAVTAKLPVPAKSAAAAPPPAKPAAAAKPVPPRPAQVQKSAGSSSKDRVRMLMVSAAALIVLLVAVGVLALMRNRVTAESEPSTPPVASETPSPTTEGTPETAPAPSTTVPAPVESTAQAQALAALTVISQPSTALVVLDRVARPQRTPATFGELTAGVHVVRVEKSGFVAQEQRVKLGDGEQRRLAFNLPREGAAGSAPAPDPAQAGIGTIAVKVRPYASYYLDGELKASNFPGATFPAKAGSHTVRAVHPLGTKEWKVMVLARKTVTLEHDFIAAGTGSIRVTSGGVWARVYLDGKDTGKTTPTVLEQLLQGDHQIELRRDGFVVDAGPQVVRVKPAQATEAKFTLKPAN